MGLTLTPINFFTDDIQIEAHTATYTHWLDGPVSVRQVSGGQRVRLFRIEETGELHIERACDGVFATGPEA